MSPYIWFTATVAVVTIALQMYNSYQLHRSSRAYTERRAPSPIRESQKENNVNAPTKEKNAEKSVISSTSENNTSKGQQDLPNCKCVACHGNFDHSERIFNHPCGCRFHESCKDTIIRCCEICPECQENIKSVISSTSENNTSKDQQELRKRENINKCGYCGVNLDQSEGILKHSCGCLFHKKCKDDIIRYGGKCRKCGEIIFK